MHAAFVVGYLLSIGPMVAVNAQVDQSCNSPPNYMSSAFNLAFDLRQEFVPSLRQLDSVELFIAESPFDPLSAVSGTVAVNIRAGFDGPIIGTSQALDLAASFRGPVLFRFSEPVDLVPGQVAVIQPVSVDGRGSWFVDGTTSLTSPGYPSGRLFFEGKEFQGDLLFKEGIGLPEPVPSVLLLATAAIVAFLKRPEGFRLDLRTCCEPSAAVDGGMARQSKSGAPGPPPLS